MNTNDLQKLVNGPSLSKKHPKCLSRYLRQGSEGEVRASIMMLSHLQKNGTVEMLGSYFGYAGAGTYEYGLFIQNDERLDVFSEEELDDIRLSDAQKETLTNLLQAMNTWLEYDEDDVPSFSELACELLDEGEEDDDDIVFMDETFDGDCLAGVSDKWNITLRFID